MRPLEQLARRVQHLGAEGAVPGVEVADEVGDLARALERSLREQRSHEELFLANASHELRTPVAALLADVQHSLSKPRSPQELRSALMRAERAGRRLRDLTSNLLTLSRARRLPERRETDLLDLAGDAVDRLQPLAIDKGLDLVLEGVPSPACLDPGLMGRLLDNLIGNALKFTWAGEVRVTVEPRGEAVELLVADSGPGLPAAARRLFEPFVRAGAAGEGFGLGLAVVREVALAHGGDVQLQAGEGGGTLARVVLPRKPLAG